MKIYTAEQLNECEDMGLSPAGFDVFYDPKKAVTIKDRHDIQIIYFEKREGFEGKHEPCFYKFTRKFLK